MCTKSCHRAVTVTMRRSLREGGHFSQSEGNLSVCWQAICLCGQGFKAWPLPDLGHLGQKCPSSQRCPTYLARPRLLLSGLHPSSPVLKVTILCFWNIHLDLVVCKFILAFAFSIPLKIF